MTDPIIETARMATYTATIEHGKRFISFLNQITLLFRSEEVKTWMSMRFRPMSARRNERKR